MDAKTICRITLQQVFAHVRVWECHSVRPLWGIAAHDPRPDATPAETPAGRPLKLLVLADTHLRGDLSPLPPEVWDELDRCDAVLHAGDVVTVDLLHALRARRPLHAVLGNNDRTLVGALPDRLELELAGVRVAMVHDSGARAGRERRMRRWFPDADLVVFGHSHAPVDAEGVDGQRLFNPGSAVQRRRQPRRTVGVLELAAGRITHHEIVPVS